MPRLIGQHEQLLLYIGLITIERDVWGPRGDRLQRSFLVSLTSASWGRHQANRWTHGNNARAEQERQQ